MAELTQDQCLEHGRETREIAEQFSDTLLASWLRQMSDEWFTQASARGQHAPKSGEVVLGVQWGKKLPG
jgi:hypothetical protein